VIVVDASAVLEMLLRTVAGDRVQDRILASPGLMHAPHLIDLEAAHVLRRLALAREVTTDRGRQALTDMADLPITRYRHDLLLERIWELRYHLSAYDAAYVALAEVLGAPLVTCDKRLGKARGHRATVEVL
jgi:predicted nucleic acid-binding protein